MQKLASQGNGTPTPDAAAILSQTDEILRSTAFRSSKRSQEILNYLVRNALDGDTERLRERVIGQEVFGRPLDYDTGQDSIVRAKVNEVRKRLAQYFDEAGAGASIRIDIPVGSYVPEFHFIHPPAGTGFSSRPRRAGRYARLAALLAAIAALSIFLVARLRTASPFDQFWGPFLDSPASVTLCVAHPQVYTLFGPQVDELILAHRPGTMAQDPAMSPTERRPLAVIIPDAYSFVGVGDAHAIGHFCGLFRSHRKACQIRRGNDTSFAELRSAPSVLIGGAFSNQWSQALLQELRYVPLNSPPSMRIFDRKEGKEIAGLPPVTKELPHTYVDYAIVSRLVRSRTGEALLGIAGISHYGTMAVAELVTDPQALERALHRVPGWSPEKNLQAILRVNVVIRAPEAPEVIASHVW